LGLDGLGALSEQAAAASGKREQRKEAAKGVGEGGAVGKRGGAGPWPECALGENSAADRWRLAGGGSPAWRLDLDRH
jgi:hypothetical protein